MKLLDYIIFNAWLAMDLIIPIMIIASVSFFVWQIVSIAIEQWKNL